MIGNRRDQNKLLRALRAPDFQTARPGGPNPIARSGKWLVESGKQEKSLCAATIVPSRFKPPFTRKGKSPLFRLAPMRRRLAATFGQLAALGLLLAFVVRLYPLPPRAWTERESPPTVPPPKPFVMTAPTVRTLSNGLKVLVIERRGLPMLTLRLVVKTGAEADPPDLAGTAQIVAGLLNEGTTHRTAFQIAETVDDAGGNVDNSAGWDESYLGLSVLADHAELAFDLVADMVMHPAFAPSEVDRARRQMTSSLELLKGDPSYVADTVYDELEFRGTAYGHPADGTVASASRVSPPDLQWFHDRYYRPSNAILAVVGDIAAEQAFALAEKFFAGWPEAPSPQPISALAPPSESHREILIVDKPDAV